MDRPEAEDDDPYRVDAADHRGRPELDDGGGILARRFELPRDLDDDDHRAPRPLRP